MAEAGPGALSRGGAGQRRAPMGSGWLRAPRQIRDRVLLLPGEGADSTQASLGKSRQRHRRFQGMRTAVGFVKMQPPCESPAWPAWRPWLRRTAPCAAAPARVSWGASRWCLRGHGCGTCRRCSPCGGSAAPLGAGGVAG